MDVNTTITVLDPVAETIKRLMSIVSVFVGGIFGLYIILFIWRIYAYKRNRRLFRRMNREIKRIEESLARVERKIDNLKEKEEEKEKEKNRKKDKSSKAGSRKNRK